MAIGIGILSNQNNSIRIQGECKHDHNPQPFKIICMPKIKGTITIYQ